jgi:hypothetical protein
VEFARANYRDPAKERRLPEAISDHGTSRKREHEQDQLSISQFSRIGRDSKLLQNHFSGASEVELTVPRLVGFLEHGQPGLNTYNNRRGIVSIARASKGV